MPEGDLDPTYRHISHWVSLRYLEYSRVEFLAAIGCAVEELISLDAFPVVTAIHVRYLREIFDERITLSCTGVEWAGRSCRILQRITKQNGKPAVEASVELKFLSQLKKRSTEAPPQFLEAIKKCAIPCAFDTLQTGV